MTTATKLNPQITTSYSSVEPSAHLPRLPNVAAMDPDAKQAALAQWVAWFNGHRTLVGSELERQLDRALRALDRQQLVPGQLVTLQDRFDRWITELPRPM